MPARSTTRPHTMARAARLAAMLLAGMLGAGLAHADLYGYVDENGVAHLAGRALDAHYRLLVRGGSLDVGTRERWPSAAPRERRRWLDALARHPALTRYNTAIAKAARSNALDPALLKAVIAIESGFDAAAISPKGAIGLMQVIPATGARYGIGEGRLAEPAINVATGARYLRDLMRMYPDRIDLALAAYNAGEGAVSQHGNQVPPYAETEAYVQAVLAMYQRFKAPAPAVGASATSTAGLPVRRIHVVLPVASHDADSPGVREATAAQ